MSTNPPNHHFISYSSADALDFALQLADVLTSGPPSFAVWLDKRDLHPGLDWDVQISDAIRDCTALLFVMTADSVEDGSVCKQEWTRALKHKKPVVPLRLHRTADLPFRLAARQFIDFTGDFAVGLAKLRTHLTWLASPAGQRQAIKDRLADAQRDLRRAQGAQEQDRLTAEIAQMQAQIAQQQPLEDQAQAAQPQTKSTKQPAPGEASSGAQIANADVAGVVDLRGADFSQAKGVVISGVTVGNQSTTKFTPKDNG